LLENQDTPLKVLVVDDNEDAAFTLSEVLKAAGYRVETCFDAQAALATADRFDPDACVLDINMPGMNGYELADYLRRRSRKPPRVLATVTAYEDFAHLTRAADSGFDLHFTKPADPNELIDQLRDCLRKGDDFDRAPRTLGLFDSTDNHEDAVE
jgi:two-component system, OmpR family, response regulator